MTGQTEQLWRYVDGIRPVDTHDHLSSPEVFSQSKRTALDIVAGAYIRDDLLSLGLQRDFFGSPLSDREKWDRLKQHLARTRNTTYFQILGLIFADLFGIRGDLLDQEWGDLSGPVSETPARGREWYDYVLKERSKVDLCLIDKGQSTDFEIEIARTVSPEGSWTKESPEATDYDLFRPVLRIDLLAHAFKPGGREAIEEKFGQRVGEFEEFEEFLNRLILDLPNRGFKAIKSLLAYTTGLAHVDPDREKAARAWRAGPEAAPAERRCFVDFVVWRLAELAAAAGLPFQIHTGLSCCGARYPLKSDPKELVPLLCANPETKFDLFHAGYPDLDHAAAMVKAMPNAFVNLNWLPALSGRVFQRYLSELLDLVPMTKISWGGDAVLVEEVYAHAKLTKQFLSSVLEEKMAQGRYGLDLCREIALRLLRQNGMELYGLEPPGDQPVENKEGRFHHTGR